MIPETSENKVKDVKDFLYQNKQFLKLYFPPETGASQLVGSLRLEFLIQNYIYIYYLYYMKLYTLYTLYT